MQAVKYVLVTLDHAARESPEPTPLDSARTPNLDALAGAGKVGAVSLVPDGWETALDVALLSLLGYDPRRFHPGHASVRAAARGLSLGPSDRLLAVELVATGPEPGLLRDAPLEPISEHESAALLGDLFAFWRRRAPELTSALALHMDGVCRGLIVDSSGRDYSNLITQPAHSAHGRAWSRQLPSGSGEAPALLQALVNLSAEFLPEHEVNKARAEQGLPTATLAWIHGHGPKFEPPCFSERHGVRACMIAADEVARGLGRGAGLECPDERPASPRDAARLAVAALPDFDLIVCCLPVAADPDAAREAVETIDTEFIPPVGAALRKRGNPEREAGREGWRILVAPTPLPGIEPVEAQAATPFLLAGAWVRSLVRRRLTEEEGAASDLHVREGHELMEYFLRGGLAGVAAGQ